VLSFLKEEDLISEERIQLLLSWRTTGVSVDMSVKVEPEDEGRSSGWRDTSCGPR